jgi:hypothetical protein
MVLVSTTRTADSLLEGPEFDALVDAVCREGETDAAIDELVELLAA